MFSGTLSKLGIVLYVPDKRVIEDEARKGKQVRDRRTEGGAEAERDREGGMRGKRRKKKSASPK